MLKFQRQEINTEKVDFENLGCSISHLSFELIWSRVFKYFVCFLVMMEISPFGEILFLNIHNLHGKQSFPQKKKIDGGEESLSKQSSPSHFFSDLFSRH